MSLQELKNKVLNQPLQVFKQLNFVKAFMALSENPNDTVRVFNLEQAMNEVAGPDVDRLFLESFQRTPGLQRMLEQRYLAPKYDIEDFKDYAPGTLGYGYYRHMHDHGFTPDFFPEIKPVDDVSYARLRMRQTHDIWHVVTGYGPDLWGELALQGFLTGQYPGPLSALIISTGLVHTSTQFPEQLGEFFDYMIEGYQRGKAAKSFWEVKWEEMWERSLDEIRAELNVSPAKELMPVY